MKKTITLLLSLGIPGLLIFFSSASPTGNAIDRIKLQYIFQLDSLSNQIQLMQKNVNANNSKLMQDQFKHARKIYKEIEYLVEYHFTESALKLNGPNLLEAKAQTPLEPTHPMGFQVLEELLWSENNFDKNAILYELENIEFAVNRLKATTRSLELTESNIFDALKLNLYRLITKGITGFDSPVALLGIEEAIYTISSTGIALQYFADHRSLQERIVATQDYLKNYSGDFDEFDRAEFISEYINPLCEELYNYQLKANIPFANAYLKAIPSDVPHMFSENAFDLFYFAPENAITVNEYSILLGKKLFNDPQLSMTNGRSCASCHDPNRAFTDGKKVNESIVEDKKLLRNTPSLINAALQPVQFYDSRIIYLEDQAHEVITNEDEMGGNFQTIANRLKKNKKYKSLFEKVYGNATITSRNINYAIAAYMRSLVAMNSSFDKYMRGDKQALNTKEIKGFNIFMGKGKCGTCHFMPLFNGTVPPLFDKMESEVLGVPATPDTVKPLLDNDSGKYILYQIPHHLYSFKTTSVRNVALTAPYMHNGVYKTLEEVIDFYNKGGGAGLGFELEHQTLPPDALGLTQEEKDNLVLFLKSLTDTVIVNR